MNYEEYMLHYGVPGMKWGKRKSIATINKELGKSNKEVRSKVKSKEITKKEGKAAIQDNRHNSRLERSKHYTKKYEKNISKGLPERKARAKAAASVALRRRVAIVGLGASIKVGMAAATIAKDFAASPEGIAMGRNIVFAATRSPLRYANPFEERDVVN